MKETVRIADQLNRSFERDAWHGPSVSEALQDVDFKTAARKTSENLHTIWEIADHISLWIYIVRKRLEGELTDSIEKDDWNVRRAISGGSWLETLSGIKSNHTQLLDYLKKINDDDLDNLVLGKDYTVYFMLQGLIQHNIYHAGQIAILKKL